jgi:hypothetical protein
MLLKTGERQKRPTLNSEMPLPVPWCSETSAWNWQVCSVSSS